MGVNNCLPLTKVIALFYCHAMTNTSWIAALNYAGTIHPQLRVSQLKFLFIVKEHPNKSLSELAELMGVTLPAISRAVDVFGSSRKHKGRDLSLGFIEASRNVIDDRVITVKLTPKGSHFIHSFLEHF